MPLRSAFALQGLAAAPKAGAMPMPESVKDLSALSLAEIATLVADKKLPPVESWHPEKCGHSAMRIARDGRWYHEGGLITRETMVRLFSSILRREADGRHVLVTPAEKLDIDVEDAAFIAVEVKSEGEGESRTLAFRLNSGDLIVAGPDHVIRTAGTLDEPAHYLGVRGGLEARLTRPVFYALAEWAITEGHAPLGLWSNGFFFTLEPAA